LRIVPFCCLGILVTTMAAAASLQAVYETAPAAQGYDRYLELETGVTYTGGLLIGPTWDDDRQEFLRDEAGLDVMIAGNGAILDLQGQQICISFCDNRLDIEDCIVLNGGIRFRGERFPDEDLSPQGSVRHCTFYRPHDYALRLQGAGEGIVLERNIVVDCMDTGLDYVIWSSEAGPNLPTGLAFGLSVQTGAYGSPEVRDNWTWFADSHQNDEPFHHFCFL
jgi:hypothetical protein